jgi:hypothetical protein
VFVADAACAAPVSLFQAEGEVIQSEFKIDVPDDMLERQLNLKGTGRTYAVSPC